MTSQKFISTTVHRRGRLRGCWNWSKPPGATVHYLPALASEVPQKVHFPHGISQSLAAHTVTICLGKNVSHAKNARSGACLGPSEAAQHLPEGFRPDLDDPGERIVELADGEEYGADQ